MFKKILKPTPDASAAAEFCGRYMMNHHRGAYDLGDNIVIFGNDGYANDPRSKREVDLVIERLTHLEILDPEFGVSNAGTTWALLIRNCHRDDLPIDDLTEMVWDSWFIVCEERVQEEVN